MSFVGSISGLGSGVGSIDCLLASCRIYIFSFPTCVESSSFLSIISIKIDSPLSGASISTDNVFPFAVGSKQSVPSLSLQILTLDFALFNSTLIWILFIVSSVSLPNSYR